MNSFCLRPYFNKLFLFLFSYCFFIQIANAQKSVLVNFGGVECKNSDRANISFIKNPFDIFPSAVASCNLQAQLPDFFDSYTSYNPKDNKVYVADVRTGVTKLWALDLGLPGGISCPASISVSPTSSYNYVANNFEFDNNGNIRSFSNFNVALATCDLKKVDISNGQVLDSIPVIFPPAYVPNTISSGDICILPNGRMFAILGDGPSYLYEILNYTGTGPAVASYLATTPKICFGIAYINGFLEISGSNLNRDCYFYDYNLTYSFLGTEKPFQIGNSPIDNTSITPAIGCASRLLNQNRVSSNAYDLTYEIYVENMGNVVMNHIQLTNDLGAIFGAGNISNIQTSFVSGANTNGLTLNSSFNGTTVNTLLNSNQNIPNKTFGSTNHFLKILLQFRVSNILLNTLYLNSAICKADIGSNNANTLIEVTDSSNNGDYSYIDLNLNGRSNESSENVPTPFVSGALPVKFLNIAAQMIDKASSKIQWQVATPIVNGSYFDVEYSYDSREWRNLKTIAITDVNKGNYECNHLNASANILFYRIKQTDNDAVFYYSKVVVLKNNAADNNYAVYPNPVKNILRIVSSNEKMNSSNAILLDLSGRILIKQNLNSFVEEINTSDLPNGNYLLKITDEQKTTTKKIIINH